MTERLYMPRPRFEAGAALVARRRLVVRGDELAPGDVLPSDLEVKIARALFNTGMADILEADDAPSGDAERGVPRRRRRRH